MSDFERDTQRLIAATMLMLIEFLDECDAIEAMISEGCPNL